MNVYHKWNVTNPRIILPHSIYIEKAQLTTTARDTETILEEIERVLIWLKNVSWIACQKH